MHLPTPLNRITVPQREVTLLAWTMTIFNGYQPMSRQWLIF